MGNQCIAYIYEFHGDGVRARRPEYLAINPNGRIPTLIDGDLVLYESMAINHYLADRYDGGLKPHGVENSARALMWSFWGTNEVENLLRPLLRNRLFLPESDRDPGAGDLAAEEMAKALRILDDALTDREFLLGDRICVADLNVSHGLFWIRLAGIDLSLFPQVGAWLDRLARRPALQIAWGGKGPIMNAADRRPLSEVDPRRGF